MVCRSLGNKVACTIECAARQGCNVHRIGVIMTSGLCFAGMAGLAAVYTHAWRGGNAQASLHAWSDALSKANGPNAHVSVVPAGAS